MIRLVCQSDEHSKQPRRWSEVTPRGCRDFFTAARALICEEPRYRVFVEIKRITGRFSFAI
jgi:hypothetical protein